MCAAALPDDAAQGDIDLAHYYIENRKRFWGFSAALHGLNLLSWTVSFALSGFALQFLPDHAGPIVANTSEALLSLTLALTRAKWWHAVMLLGLWIWNVTYFGPMQLH